jgi:hypothetical protein
MFEETANKNRLRFSMLALISSTQHMCCIARTADRLFTGIWFYFLIASNKNLKKKKGSTVDQKHMTRAISNSATRSISNTFLVPSTQRCSI